MGEAEAGHTQIWSGLSGLFSKPLKILVALVLALGASAFSLLLVSFPSRTFQNRKALSLGPGPAEGSSFPS